MCDERETFEGNEAAEDQERYGEEVGQEVNEDGEVARARGRRGVPGGWASRRGTRHPWPGMGKPAPRPKIPPRRWVGPRPSLVGPTWPVLPFGVGSAVPYPDQSCTCHPPTADSNVSDPEPPAVQDEVTRTARATVGPWKRIQVRDSSPATLNTFPTQAGVYIVERRYGAMFRPVYVGQAENLQHRWRGRLQGLFQVGLLDSSSPGTEPVICVWVATVAKADLRVVEHALIRTIINYHLVPSSSRNLRNLSFYTAFRSGGVRVQNILPRPYVARVVGDARLQVNKVAGIATLDIPASTPGTPIRFEGALTPFPIIPFP